MNFSESFKQALDSLKSNKLRSFLTMLGIVMGVFSIITIMALSSATESYMNAQFEKIGANTVSIGYKNMMVEKKHWLTLEDMDYVKKVAPEIKNIATYIQRSGSLRVGPETKDAVILGVSSQYKNFDLIEMTYGRFINDFDVSKRMKSVIVDESFVRKFYKDGQNIVGETITLKTSSGSSVNLKVIGVKSSGENMFEGIMESDMIPAIIYMPITTVQSLYNSERLDSISVSVVDKDQLRDIGKKIVNSLELKHGGEDLYLAQNSADIQKAIGDILDVVSSILLVIAIITLIVGGIGIVNILLVSVTERIREIGIRKALGAQKRDIVMQFITESIIMTGISGLMGILLGVLSGNIISYLISIPPVVDFKVITLAFLGSVALGLIFGVYPAKRAADLDPIESLRYE
ncbi:MAG: FtsX-like permease family protein [Clostridiaceae bacterium]|nr:FtsX-like permease family protein [Clostridiaceae bacterium]